MFVFVIAELAKTKVAGLFTFANDIPLVGLNPAQRDARRARWTLAHEYAHFVTNRFDAEVTYPEGSPRSRDAYEVLPTGSRRSSSSRHPGSRVDFLEVAGDKRNLSVASILLLAAEFEVSFMPCANELRSWTGFRETRTNTSLPADYD
jgi:hypothetical protein